MTDKEIIKALRCCKFGEPCTRCPVVRNENCVDVMHERAADRIKQLIAENTALREGASLGRAKRPQKIAYEKSIEFLRAVIDGQSGEIKSLRKEIEWKDMVIALAQREQAKAEAERDTLREKTPHWISVEDRLPNVWKNEDAGVLVNYMIYGPYFGANIGTYYKGAEEWLCAGLPVTVTHWMPLPEAPEEGEAHGTADI